MYSSLFVIRQAPTQCEHVSAHDAMGCLPRDPEEWAIKLRTLRSPTCQSDADLDWGPKDFSCHGASLHDCHGWSLSTSLVETWLQSTYPAYGFSSSSAPADLASDYLNFQKPILKRFWIMPKN